MTHFAGVPAIPRTHFAGVGELEQDVPETIPEIARRRVAELADLDVAGGTARAWCVWNPIARAWYECAPGELEVTFVEDVERAWRFTRAEAVQVWIRSGYDDVPVPFPAARELMATLERFAAAGSEP